MRNYSSLVLCGLFVLGSSTYGAAGSQGKPHALAASKSAPVVVKMSATRELLSDADHIGGDGKSGGAQVIVEMEAHPVTIVIPQSTKTDPKNDMSMKTARASK